MLEFPRISKIKHKGLESLESLQSERENQNVNQESKTSSKFTLLNRKTAHRSKRSRNKCIWTLRVHLCTKYIIGFDFDFVFDVIRVSMLSTFLLFLLAHLSLIYITQYTIYKRYKWKAIFGSTRIHHPQSNIESMNHFKWRWRAKTRTRERERVRGIEKNHPKLNLIVV